MASKNQANEYTEFQAGGDHPNLVVIGVYLIALLAVRRITFFRNSVSYKPIMLIFAMINGLVALFYAEEYNSLLGLDFVFLCFIYLSLIVMSSVNNMDFYYFRKLLPEILILSTIGVVIQAVSIAFFISLYLKFKYSFSYSLYAGIALASSERAIIFSRYSDNLSSRKVSIMLEGESVIGLIFCVMFYQLFEAYELSYVDTFSRAIAFISRKIILGAIIGIISGKLFILTFSKHIYGVYDRALGMVLLSSIVFTICHYFAGCSAHLAVFCCSVLLASERSKFSVNYNKQLRVCLNIVFAVIEFFVASGLFHLMFRAFRAYKYFPNIAESFCLCLIRYIVRIILLGLLMLVSCITGQIKWDFRATGLFFLQRKGTTQLMLMLFEAPKIRIYPELLVSCFVHGIVFICFDTLVATFVLQLSSLRSLSTLEIDREYNLNYCKKLLELKLVQIKGTMRSSFLYFGANWNMLNSITMAKEKDPVKNTTLTLLKRKSVCNECHKVVAITPGREEWNEMKMAARFRIYKFLHSLYTAHYENGFISINHYKFLLHQIDYVKNTDKMTNVVDIIETFRADTFLKKFYRFIKQDYAERRVPSVPLYKLSYYVNESIFYELFILSVNVAYIVRFFEVYAVTYEFECIFFTIHLFDAFLRIFSMSTRSFEEGFMDYIRNKWHIFEVFILFLHLILIIYLFVETHFMYVLITPIFSTQQTYLYFYSAIQLRILRIIFFLMKCRRILENACKSYIEKKQVFAFDLTSALYFTNAELFHKLKTLIDNKDLRELLRTKITNYMELLNTELCRLLEENPNVSELSKTKLATRTVLYSLKTFIKMLKINGLADDKDCLFYNYYVESQLLVALSLKISDAAKLSYNCLEHISWIEQDRNSNFLVEKAVVVKFKKGERVLSVGDKPPGVYVIKKGYLWVEYEPSLDLLYDLYNYGSMPIVGYKAFCDLTQPQKICLGPGACVGYLAILNKKHCTFSLYCHSDTSAYLISSSNFEKAVRMNNNPIDGLFSNTWKYAITELAFDLLRNKKFYEKMSLIQVYLKLQSAIVPDLPVGCVFVFTDIIEDKLLVQGVAVDVHTEKEYIAPVYIPRFVYKLEFVNKDEKALKPVLFLIPVRKLRKCILKINVVTTRKPEYSIDYKEYEESSIYKKAFIDQVTDIV